MSRRTCKSFALTGVGRSINNWTMSFYTIKEAIRAGLRLKLSLPDGEHIVEPHVLGRDRRGKTLLRAYPGERAGR